MSNEEDASDTLREGASSPGNDDESHAEGRPRKRNKLKREVVGNGQIVAGALLLADSLGGK